MQQAPDPLWSTFGATFEHLEREAPEGYVPVVEVQLLNGDTLKTGNVREIPPWVCFEEDIEAEPGGGPTSVRRVVAVLREQIAKVEIRYIRAEGRQALGFRIEPPLDEDAAP
jgi:hypothetical protein